MQSVWGYRWQYRGKELFEATHSFITWEARSLCTQVRVSLCIRWNSPLFKLLWGQRLVFHRVHIFRLTPNVGSHMGDGCGSQWGFSLGVRLQVPITWLAGFQSEGSLIFKLLSHEADDESTLPLAHHHATEEAQVTCNSSHCQNPLSVLLQQLAWKHR